MAMPGTACPASGLTSAALPGRRRRERAVVSEAPGWQFDLRGSREPRAAGGSALFPTQPPGGCLRRNPRPLGLVPSATVHAGCWPEAVTKPSLVTLEDKGRSGDPALEACR